MSKETEKVIDTKVVLKTAAEEKRVIKFTDRVKLKVIKKTKHYKLGQEINPHRVFAEELIKNKIAKAV